MACDQELHLFLGCWWLRFVTWSKQRWAAVQAVWERRPLRVFKKILQSSLRDRTKWKCPNDLQNQHPYRTFGSSKGNLSLLRMVCIVDMNKTRCLWDHHFSIGNLRTLAGFNSSTGVVFIEVFQPILYLSSSSFSLSFTFCSLPFPPPLAHPPLSSRFPFLKARRFPSPCGSQSKIYRCFYLQSYS